MINFLTSSSNRSIAQGQNDYIEGVNWNRFAADADYKLGVLMQHQELRHKKAGYEI